MQSAAEVAAEASPRDTGADLGTSALRLYAERLQKADAAGEGELGHLRQAFFWHDSHAADEESDEGEAEDEGTLESAARAALERELGVLELVCLPDEAERLKLCKVCARPLGDVVYEDQWDSDHGLMHGECMAQIMLRDLQKERLEREGRQAEEKRARRREFDIGWKAECIPRSVGPAQRLRGCSVPEGHCCLLLQDGGRSLRLAPTAEPAAAINLEYLSTALRVRKRHGREPLFSLDPVGNAADPRKSWQEKRFEPAWLVGTSVGEVLFQSDYHLKELSMGEYEQPVVGMKSCFDFSEEEGCPKEWNAREWFVVKKAEVQISEDRALIPCLRMAVEAREQVKGEHGLEDVKFTRPSHPLVRYAEAFTHNFDLIAERKSVVYHLRELAKASILAKFLVEAGVELDESWFNLADEPAELCVLEVPQLWNDRVHSQIRVQDGKILNIDSGFDQNSYSLYGGVQFGLDRFQLSGGRGPARQFSAGLSARTFVQPGRYLSAGLQSRQMQRSFGPLGGMAQAGARGVDLNLDNFSLSAASGGWAGTVQAPEACTDIGSAFWSSIGDDSDTTLKGEDKALFRSVFNPNLSDRRDDADVFMPPDTSPVYLQRLRSLVGEEEQVQCERRAHFSSASFDLDAPGPLYPSSWTTADEISRQAHQRSEFHLRPDYRAQARLVKRALKTAVPAFDKSAEDGLRFRAYRFGSLEVRTVQEHGGPEAVAAVLSAAAPGREPGAARARAEED